MQTPVTGSRGARLWIALALAGLALASPTSALAGTASVSGDTISYAGGAEANNVTVSGGVFGSWFVADSAGTTPGPGCTKQGHSVKCTASGVTRLLIEAGDGNDTVTNFTWTAATLRGGGGDDTLYGGFASEILEGGDGVDGLFGSGGNDLLDGGAGDDALNAGSGADTLDGGAGNDGYSAEAGADTVRSRDSVSEQVDCGDDADTALADPADVPAGCEQVDAGDAPLPPIDVPEIGGDAGGSGGSGGSGDSSSGGSTGDGGAPDPTVPVETLVSGLQLLAGTAPALITPAGKVDLNVECPADNVGGCRGTITLELVRGEEASAARRGRKPVRKIGKKRFNVAPAAQSTVRVRVSRRGRRIVSRRNRTKIRAKVETRMADGSTKTTYENVQVKAARRGGKRPRKSGSR
jgi:hypothetical protein